MLWQKDKSEWKVARLKAQTLFSFQIMSKDVLHVPVDCEGTADVKASSYPVCPFLSIRDDKAARLIPSLIRLTKKRMLIREKKKRKESHFGN